MVLARGGVRGCPLLFAASGALLAALLLTPSPPLGGSHETPVAVDLPASASPHLAIDPASWWMPAGNSTPFVAAWVDPTPGCALWTDWFRWSVVGSSPEGVLNATGGTNVTFVATSVVSGVTTLRVRSAAILDCGSIASALVASAAANVTVIAPISLQNLSTSPNPISAGGISALQGTLAGGEPPYTLRITWGDGNVSSVVVPSSGTFSVPHAFAAGSYLPSVVVTDSAGLLANGTVGETLVSSGSLAVGIAADATETDVGAPVRFNATVLDEPPGSSTGWSCGAAPGADPGDRGASTDFSCAFSRTGTGEVFFEVLPPVPLPPASATLFESVVALPTLVAVSPNVTGEVGEPSTVAFDVTGGVPPLHLNWSEIGTSIAGALTLNTDGRALLSVVPARAGSLGLVARLVDADGTTTSNVTTGFVVDPPLTDSVRTGRAVSAAGADLALTASVGAGVPPFLWVVAPGSAPVNESSPAGSLGELGSFEWQGSYTTEGWTTVTVAVVDAAGGYSVSDLAWEGVAPLGGNITTDPGDPPAPGTFDLGLSLSGGLPPFTVEINASDGLSSNRTVSSDGNSSWSFSVEQGGTLQVEVVATDALGAVRTWNATVTIAPAFDVAPLAPLPAAEVAVSVVLLIATAVVFGGLLLRRRGRRSAPAAPPDPVVVLRRILEPADGADRATVELLAEEAGVTLESARATIDRLIVDGTIRSETDFEGEEVLAWSAVAGR